MGPSYTARVRRHSKSRQTVTAPFRWPRMCCRVPSALRAVTSALMGARARAFFSRHRSRVNRSRSSLSGEVSTISWPSVTHTTWAVGPGGPAQSGSATSRMDSTSEKDRATLSRLRSNTRTWQWAAKEHSSRYRLAPKNCRTLTGRKCRRVSARRVSRVARSQTSTTATSLKSALATRPLVESVRAVTGCWWPKKNSWTPSL